MIRFSRIFVLFLLLATPALAEKRIALVIGNSAYRNAPALPNPRNDAEATAAALKRLNFEVLLGTDLEKQPMERLLQRFAEKLDGADVALVFYAGHGLQVSGSNYLIPVDAKLDRETDLAFQAISFDLVQRLMEQGQRVNIMVLDACRDNPLARNLARSMGTRSAGIGRGLGQTQAGIGTLIVYATQPGNVALDGEGEHSPFTAALLANLETRGLEVRQVFTRVRQAVIQSTKGKQVPWDSSSLTGDWYFTAAPASPGPGSTPPAAVTPPAPGTDQETVFWQSIKDSKNAADYKAYLEKYPQGTFAALAKIRIGEIEKAAVVTPHVPGKPETRPAAPEAPKRTSTFEVGTARDGEFLEGNTYAPNARECEQRCLNNPQCVAWDWSQETKEAKEPRYCALLKRVTKRPTRVSYITSGVVGATPEKPARPAPPRRTSTFERDTAINGGILEIATVASAQACQALCIARAKCVAWVWPHRETKGPGLCNLKSDMMNRVHGADAMSGEIKLAPGAAPVPTRSSAFQPGIQLYGVELGSWHNAADARACAADCRKSDSCVAWAFQHQFNACHLISHILTDPFKNKEFTSGVVRPNGSN